MLENSDERGDLIGRVLARAAALVAAAPGVTATVALVFGALPATALGYLLDPYWSVVERWDGVLGFAALTVISLVIGTALATFASGVFAPIAAAYGSGEPMPMGSLLQAIVGSAWRLPLLSLTVAAAIYLGLLLVVPGLLLATGWAVAAPALVQERRSVCDALTRSRELTRGMRWGVIGLLLIVTAADWLFLIATELVLIGVFQGWEAFLEKDIVSMPSTYWLWTLVPQTLATTGLAAVYAALFVELRDRKHGPDPTRLVAVFE